MQASMSLNIQKRLADKHEVWVYAQVKKKLHTIRHFVMQSHADHNNVNTYEDLGARSRYLRQG